ncbi:MAG: LPXTG cell wall anchor domain-containing protein [Gemmatimonadota bacterium]
MSKVKLAALAVLFAFALWCATHVQAMPQGMKVIVEDDSGPWLVLAAVVSVGGGVFLARRRK